MPPPIRRRPPRAIPPLIRSHGGIDLRPTLKSVTPNSDRIAGGITATLTGTNFRLSDTGTLPQIWLTNPATAYSAQASGVVLVDSQTITFTVPPADFTALFDIELRIVDALNFQTAFLLGSFTYASSAIISISPPYGPLAGGTTVLIFGFNFVTGSTITFGGSPATSVLFIDSQHYSAVTPNHALGAVDVVITEPGLSTSTLRNGFQYTLLTRANDIRRTPGIIINDQLNNTPNNCAFTVDGQSNRPTVGEKVEIIDAADSNRLLFAGSAQRVEQIYEELIDQLAWRVECVDWTWLANRRRPFGIYTNVSASEVAIDLNTRFAPGFTAAHVQTNLAKVTVEFDGSLTLGQCYDMIAAMIGGGHWYYDYVQDLHFFHVVSENLSLGPIPPPVIISVVGTPMTVEEGTGIPSTFRFNPGYYFFRHTFVYSDGTESEFQACSNVLYLTGANILEFSNIPLGAAIGPLTCVKRRIYYNEMLSGKYGGGRALSDVLKFLEIDNTITAFTTWFGLTGISDLTITAIASTLPIPVKAFTGHPVGPDTALTATININSGSAYYNGGRFQFRVANLYRDGTVSFAGVASETVIKWLKTNEGVRSFTFSVIPLGDTINGVDVIARLIYVSTGGFAEMPNQRGTDAWWADKKTSGDEVYDEEGSDGFWRRSGMGGEPDWSPDNTKGVWIVPDNETEDIQSAVMGNPAGGSAGKSFAQVLAELQASHAGGDLYADFGSRIGYNDALVLQGMGSVPTTFAALAAVIGTGDLKKLMTPAVADPAIGLPLVGFANVPYWSVGQLSEDPLPNWPNNDGPSLELDPPPDDIDSLNTTMLKTPPFTSSVDLSQIRNRIFVIGSGSSVVAAGAIGATELQVADITQFSPSGGTVRVGNQILGYHGVTGTPDQAFIVLSSTLSGPIKQGATINNFLEANHLGSQQLLGKVELDKDGNPTDGVHEYTIVNGDFKAPFQLWMAAQAELELYAMPIITVHYATRDPKSKSGAMVHIDQDDPPCQGDFLIQEVSIDQIHDESDELIPRRQVTACSVRYELNDLLLQILKNKNGGGGATLVGIVPSAITATVGATTTGATFRKRGECFSVFSPPSTGTFTPGPSGIILSAFSGGVAPTGKIDVRGSWFTNRIASTAGANGYSMSSIRLGNLAQLPKVTWRVLTSTVADSFHAYGQYIMALADKGSAWLGDSNESGIYVRRNSGNWPAFTGGSSSWQIVVVQEGGLTTTYYGPVIQPDTVYIVIIEATGPTSARVSINEYVLELNNLNITDYLCPCGTVQHYSNDPKPNIGLWLGHILWESN